jgi:hypothetical protein
VSKPFTMAALSLLVLASLPLGGCSGINRALGIEKVVPDEFAVVSRAPLAIPPDYTLRPPRPGAAPTQELSPTESARQTIFKAASEQPAVTGQGNDRRSTGESELLRAAGAGSASGDIRQTLAKETQNPGAVDQSFVDRLLFWRGGDPAPAKDQVIDPNAEAQRLKTAPTQTSANPAPALGGLTGAPTIERAKDPSMVATF